MKRSERRTTQLDRDYSTSTLQGSEDSRRMTARVEAEVGGRENRVEESGRRGAVAIRGIAEERYDSQSDMPPLRTATTFRAQASAPPGRSMSEGSDERASTGKRKSATV